MGKTNTIIVRTGESITIDEKDFDWLSQFKWHLGSKTGNKGYASTSLKVGGKLKGMYMHRLILGAKKGQIADHINGDGWDNRRSNLRLTNHTGNAINKSKHKNASSQFKGVSWHKTAKKWTASVGHDYKVINLGLFVSEIEAARAWDVVAKKLHGSLAKLNYA